MRDIEKRKGEKGNQNMEKAAHSKVVTFICTQNHLLLRFLKHFNIISLFQRQVTAQNPSKQFLVPSCRSKFPFIHYLPSTKEKKQKPFLRLCLCSKRKEKKGTKKKREARNNKEKNIYFNIFVYTHRHCG